MAFNRDINSIFDRYVNNILEAVKPTEEGGPLEQETSWMKSLGNSLRPSTGPAAAPAAAPEAAPVIPIATAGVPKTKDQQMADYNKAKELFKLQTGKDYTKMGDLSPEDKPVWQGILGSVAGIEDTGLNGGPYSYGTLQSTGQEIKPEITQALETGQAAEKEYQDTVQSGATKPVVPVAPVAPPATGTSPATTGGYTQQQIDAFNKANSAGREDWKFKSNSRVDMEKMEKMFGKPGQPQNASTALPSAGMRPGQLKTSAPATTPQSTVPNSKLPGVFGSISNAAGRVGDTVQNIAQGKAGTGAQPRPISTNTTQPPSSQPQQSNQRPKFTYQKAGR